VLFTSAALAQSGQPAGRIDGVIQTADGKPVAGATVWIAARSESPGAPFVPFTGAVQTAADGTFHAFSIPNGRYAVCPEPPDGYLSPCVWEVEPAATVANGAATTIPTIQLKSGIDFHVRVNDPSGIRAVKEGKVPGASLLLGISVGGRRPVRIQGTATDKVGTDYHLTVPPDTPLIFIAHGRAYALTDGSGKSADPQKGFAVPITLPAVVKQHTEVINIQ
jgi:hypothetical protein